MTTALLPHKNSTIVRSLLNLHPGAAAWLSERLFTRTPKRRRARPAERDVLATATRTDLGLGTRTIATYAWGDTGPTVLLVHGWGGSAAQMTGFVRPIRERGFRVVAIDQPGHGASAGRSTDVGEMARVLRRVADLVGPIHAVVAHSLGAASAALAVHDGLYAERIVLLAPAVEPGRYWHGFMRWLGLSDASRRVATSRVLRRLGIPLEGANISHTLARVDSDILVVHDELDRSTPVDASRALVAGLPDAHGLWTRGLGHARGLADPRVIEPVVDLVVRGRWPSGTMLTPCATPWCERAAEPDGGGRCLSCAVEADLRSHFGDHPPAAA